MEWVTQTDWPMDYITYIRMHHTPGHRATSRAIFDEDWNLLKLRAWPRKAWNEKIGAWDHEDTSKDGPAAHWGRWSGEQRRLYLQHYGDLDKRMGYNQDHPGSTDTDWEQRDRFGEV
jgi:hypothetical protein